MTTRPAKKAKPKQSQPESGASTEQSLTSRHDPVAERNLIGACLLHEPVAQRLAVELRPQAFYLESCRLAFVAICDMVAKGQRIDAVGLVATLRDHGTIAQVGGGAELDRLSTWASVMQVDRHIERLRLAEMMRNAAMAARALELELSEVQGLEAQDRETVEAAIARFANGAVEVASASESTTDDVDYRESLSNVATFAQEAADNRSAGKIIGVPTGLPTMDRDYVPLRGKRLIIIAARPSMGKSALAGCWAAHAADRDHGVGVFTLEMPAEEYTTRMLAADTGIHNDRIGMGDIHRHEWDRMFEAVGRTATRPIRFYRGQAVELATVLAKFRAWKRQHGIGLGIVDHIGLIDVPSVKADNAVGRITHITRALKLLSRELDIPIIAISQLNRNLEGRTDKRPVLSDLRESGSIEQDADVVIMPHRPGYYDEKVDPAICDMYIRKNRGGKLGSFACRFEANVMRFVELDTTGRTPPPETGGAAPQDFKPAPKGRRMYWETDHDAD